MSRKSSDVSDASSDPSESKASALEAEEFSDSSEDEHPDHGATGEDWEPSSSSSSEDEEDIPEGEELIFTDAFAHCPQAACVQGGHGLYAAKRFAFLTRKHAEAHSKLGSAVQQVISKDMSQPIKDGAPTFTQVWEVLRQTIRDTNKSSVERGLRLNSEIVEPILRAKKEWSRKFDALSKRQAKQTARIEQYLKKVEAAKRSTQSSAVKTYREWEKDQQGKRSLLSKLKSTGAKRLQEKTRKEALKYLKAIETFNAAQKIYYETENSDLLDAIQSLETSRLELLQLKLEAFCDIESEALEPVITAINQLRDAIEQMNMEDDVLHICNMKKPELKLSQQTMIMDESLTHGVRYELPWSPEDIEKGLID